MRLKSVMAAMAAAGIMIAPVPASAQAEEAAGGLLVPGTGSYLIPLLALAAVVGGIGVAVSSDETSPTSP